MSLRSNNEWRTCCGRAPREQIVFFTQVIIAYVVIITSLINLCLSSQNTCLWATLVSGTIGYLLPAPTIKHESAVLYHTAV